VLLNCHIIHFGEFTSLQDPLCGQTFKSDYVTQAKSALLNIPCDGVRE